MLVGPAVCVCVCGVVACGGVGARVCVCVRVRVRVVCAVLCVSGAAVELTPPRAYTCRRSVRFRAV
jgi:hypothetical protein